MPTCIMRRTCGDYVVIEHNGDVYACDFFVEPEWKFGNLLERPLSELLRSERARQFKQRKRQLAPECKRCRWLRLCYGGCPKYRLFNGGVDRTNYFCIAYKRFFAHAHRRYLRLAERIM
ncbi:MAG TPA: SPASM domain-containing protein [Armatimonadetes bacterium]|nr:SPASM domain-containing protein [Armatimonadota bacterium]